MTDLVPADDALPDVRPPKGDRRALRALPEEYRKPAAFFWGLNAHLLPTPLTLVFRLQVWIAKEGLTIDECREAFNALASPERAQNHRFAGDLLADLAAEVARVTGRRRQRAAEEAWRRSQQEAARDALPPGEIHRLLAGIGKPPRDPR